MKPQRLPALAVLFWLQLLAVAATTVAATTERVATNAPAEASPQCSDSQHAAVAPGYGRRLLQALTPTSSSEVRGRSAAETPAMISPDNASAADSPGAQPAAGSKEPPHSLLTTSTGLHSRLRDLPNVKNMLWVMIVPVGILTLVYGVVILVRYSEEEEEQSEEEGTKPLPRIEEPWAVDRQVSEEEEVVQKGTSLFGALEVPQQYLPEAASMEPPTAGWQATHEAEESAHAEVPDLEGEWVHREEPENEQEAKQDAEHGDEEPETKSEASVGVDSSTSASPTEKACCKGSDEEEDTVSTGTPPSSISGEASCHQKRHLAGASNCSVRATP